MVSQVWSGVEEGRCYGVAPKICAPAPHWLALNSAHLCALASQSMKDLDSYVHGQGGIGEDAYVVSP